MVAVDAFPPPPGITQNFVSPPSIAWQVTAISLPFSCLATFFVALRIFTRAFLVRSTGIDDLFVVVALVVSWAFAALGIAAIPYGYGVDLWNIHFHDVTMFLKIDLGGQLTYFLGTLFLKLSILLFYLRLNPDRAFRRIAYAIGIFDVVYITLSCGIAALGCTPIAGSWDISIQSSCVNKKAYYYAQAVFNILTDFATLFLPINMCIKLQLPRRQRWMLGGLFAVGSFACVVSIVRLVTMIPSLHSMNFTVFKVNVAAWCEVEINTGIICACLPTLKPLLNRLWPSFLSATKKSSDPSSQTNPPVPSNPTYSYSNEYDSAGPLTFSINAYQLEPLSEEEKEEREAENIRQKIRGWDMECVGFETVVERSESASAGRFREEAEGSAGSVYSDEVHPGEVVEKKRLASMGSGVVKTVGYDVRYGNK